MPAPEPESDELRAALEPYRARFRKEVPADDGESMTIEEDPDIDQRAFTALCIDYVRAYPGVSMDAVMGAVKFRRA